MEIFIIREGRQAGPFREEAVRAFLTEGTARPADMGWRKGMAEWKPLHEVLKPEAGPLPPEQRATSADAATPPVVAANGTAEEFIRATGKQKAFLKYLGAEFGEHLTKERAALAVSDAVETPKLQARIRKWHDDKLRLHADLFQDEIDFRKANRTVRYLDRIQTEGSGMLKDVTKAHVQVLLESLDKRQPGWESEPESALWDHLLPAIGEHFPQLVQPGHKGHLKAGSAARAHSVTRGLGMTAGVSLPPRPGGTFGAMIRGVALGMIVLGAIVFGQKYWQRSHEQPVALAPAVPEKKDPAPMPPAASDRASNEPISPLPGNLVADVKPPLTPAEDLPPAPPPEPPPAPTAPAETPAPAPAMNAEKPAAPAPPEEKPVAVAPSMRPETPGGASPPLTAPAAPPRSVVKLTQNIGVALPNGQVTLVAGTVLRFLAIEGQNVRVSWNNNVFFVPGLATDVNEPAPAPTEPATNAPPVPMDAAAGKPKKPSDDL